MTVPEVVPHRPSMWRLPRTRLLLLPSLLFLPVVGGRHPEAPMPVTLFAFDRADEANWTVVNDGVMGGRSAGFVTVEDGALRFAGTLVTQGGGFASLRARRVIDLTGQLGLELRVRGSGRQFEVELDDGVRGYGRSVSRRAAFPTEAEWALVRVPFSALRSTIFGREVNAPPIDLARVRSVGIYMADGQDGPFRLEVDFIRAYSAREERREGDPGIPKVRMDAVLAPNLATTGRAVLARGGGGAGSPPERPGSPTVPGRCQPRSWEQGLRFPDVPRSSLSSAAAGSVVDWAGAPYPRRPESLSPLPGACGKSPG